MGQLDHRPGQQRRDGPLRFAEGHARLMPPSDLPAAPRRHRSLGGNSIAYKSCYILGNVQWRIRQWRAFETLTDLSKSEPNSVHFFLTFLAKKTFFLKKLSLKNWTLGHFWTFFHGKILRIALEHETICLVGKLFVGSKFLILSNLHPRLAEQDQWAEDTWLLLTNLLAERASSMAYHSHSYPGMFALLTSPGPRDQEALCLQLKQGYAAF